MRVVIQRVSRASVRIAERIAGEIGTGLLVLVGFEEADQRSDIDWICKKISGLRIFNDPQGVMNLSVLDMDGELLLISQFTLHASVKKGNRPSYIRAAKPDIAIPLYEELIASLEKSLGKKIATGIFGADMLVELINDGPVTIWMDSKDPY